MFCAEIVARATKGPSVGWRGRRVWWEKTIIKKKFENKIVILISVTIIVTNSLSPLKNPPLR